MPDSEALATTPASEVSDSLFEDDLSTIEEREPEMVGHRPAEQRLLRQHKNKGFDRLQ